MSKIANNVKDECYKCNGCIFFNEDEEYCYRDELSANAKEVCKSPLLKQYIFTLVEAYNRYDKNRYSYEDERDKAYFEGMMDATIATINDLGFGYLIYGEVQDEED